MKKILVATDLSARSDRAVQRALSIAHERQATLEILHVVDDTLPAAIVRSHEAEAHSAVADQLSVMPLVHEVRCATAVVRGEAHDEVLRRADEFGADLVVLGIHRHTTLDLFRGTTSERVLRFGHLPVLVVRDPVVRSYRRVLVGVDLSVHSRRALDVAAELVPGGEFLLVHATHAAFRSFLAKDTTRELIRREEKTVRAEVQRQIADLKAAHGPAAPRFEFVFTDGPVREVLRASIARLKPDLVAMGTHGRTGIGGAILGSVAEDLLADAPVDILAVKA